jgi:hypothetical protein
MMKVFCFQAVALCCLATLSFAKVLLPRRMAVFDLQHPAVATFADSFPGSTGPALLVTTFFPFGNDNVVAVPSVATLLKGEAANVTSLDAAAEWPNQADPVPKGAVTAKPANSFVLTAQGFFVSPQKSTGSVNLLDVTKFPTVVKQQVSTDKSANFYHQAVWHDVNGDGMMDIIAARTYKPLIFGTTQSNLVWMEQPANPSDPWVERQLTDNNGPGVAFALLDLDNNGQMQVVGAQFFAKQQLAIFVCAAGKWSQCENGTGVTTVIVDDSEHAPYFNVQWVDLNGDGKKDLLCTTNEANGKGSVIAYEQPSDWRIVSWPKHTLATGYTPIQPYLPGRGSPGTARAFQLDYVSRTQPSILVSADDGGFVDLLLPSDVAFSYQKFRVVNSTNTIGSLAIGDIDGDGYPEFAVPLYAENKVALYTFNPAGEEV